MGRGAIMKVRALNCFMVLVPALMAIAFFLAPVRAHELRPAIATAGFDAPGRLVLDLSVNLEALIAEIGAGHEDTSQSDNAAIYDRLRALGSDDLRAELGNALEPSAYLFQVGDDVSVGKHRAL